MQGTGADVEKIERLNYNALNLHSRMQLRNNLAIQKHVK